MKVSRQDAVNFVVQALPPNLQTFFALSDGVLEAVIKEETGEEPELVQNYETDEERELAQEALEIEAD